MNKVNRNKIIQIKIYQINCFWSPSYLTQQILIKCRWLLLWISGQILILFAINIRYSFWRSWMCLQFWPGGFVREGSIQSRRICWCHIAASVRQSGNSLEQSHIDSTIFSSCYYYILLIIVLFFCRLASNINTVWNRFLFPWIKQST